MGELDGSRYTCTEPDAVIRAVYIVVHCLWTCDNVKPFVVQALAVAQRVVAANWNEDIDADVLEIPENVLRDVIDRLIVSIEMTRHSAEGQVARACSRRMKEGSTRSAGAIHYRFGQILNAFGIIRAVAAIVIDQPGPAASNTDYTITLAQCTDGNRSDCGIETGDVAAAGENCNRAFNGRHSTNLLKSTGCSR